MVNNLLDDPRILLDCGGSSIRAAVSSAGQIHPPVVAPLKNGQELATIHELIDHLLATIKQMPRALSMAVPGVIDHKANALMSAHGKYESLRGFDLKSWAESKWNLRFHLENDARAALLGEVSTGVSNAVALILGTGIGTAAIVDGTLVRGHSGHGGILGGHMTVDINSEACVCGNRGCAESIASSWALTKNHPSLASGGIESLAAAARSGEAMQAALLSMFAEVWGATVVSLCHMFDPETIVITGAPMKSSDLILPAIANFIDNHLWTSMTTPRIYVPKDPELSVFRGLDRLSNPEKVENLP